MILKLPMGPELVFFNRLLSIRNTKMVLFLASLKLYFYRKCLNLKKNPTKSEQISRVHTKLQSSITPRKKNEIQKKILILNSTLDQLFNDTTHISLQ